MKDVQFFAVMPLERKSKSASKAYPFDPFTRARLGKAADAGQWVECFGLDTADHNGRSWRYNPGGGAITCNGPEGRDSVAYCGVSLEWLRARCVRISEDLARRLHPEIVRYMESE